MSFPTGFGDLGDLSFEEVFVRFPKWVACVDRCWTENNTGLFKQFYEFVKRRLSEKIFREEHDARCRQLVASMESAEIPQYLVNYAVL